MIWRGVNIWTCAYVRLRMFELNEGECMCMWYVSYKAIYDQVRMNEKCPQ